MPQENRTIQVIDLEPSIFEQVRMMVQRGAGFEKDARIGHFLEHHNDWEIEMESLVDLIDPHGDSSSDTLATRWESAKNAPSSTPINAREFILADRFLRCLSVARTLVTGKAKVVRIAQDDSIQSKCVFHKREIAPDESLVFTLMPFTEEWSDHLWKDRIKPIVEGIPNLRLACKRADDIFGQDVVQDIYESIVAARIIIAETTNLNANVFYELGMAHTLGKDVIFLAQGSEHIPFDLNRFRHCIYSLDEGGSRKLESYLPRAIEAILRSE